MPALSFLAREHPLGAEDARSGCGAAQAAARRGRAPHGTPHGTRRVHAHQLRRRRRRLAGRAASTRLRLGGSAAASLRSGLFSFSPSVFFFFLITCGHAGATEPPLGRLRSDFVFKTTQNPQGTLFAPAARSLVELRRKALVDWCFEHLRPEDKFLHTAENEP